MSSGRFELDPGGTVANTLDAYEHRPGQVAMAEAVEAVLEHGGTLLVEAGTGTGKSFAYLIPAIQWAVDRGKRVIVSTNTIHLQEQVVRTDLPTLARGLDVTFAYALAKGRRNYACVRKAAEVRATPRLITDPAHERDLRAILEWIEETQDGSLADLGFQPSRESWSEVTVEYDECLRSRCTDYDRCFFYEARRRAADAHVLVVNHHLLMADLALRHSAGDDLATGVLPPSDHFIIDEAHHLPDVATEHFALRVSAARIEQTLGRLVSARASRRGLLPGLLVKLSTLNALDDRVTGDGARRFAEERVIPAVRSALDSTRRTFDDLLGALASLGPDKGTLPPQLRTGPHMDTDPAWQRTCEELRRLSGVLAALADSIQPILERLATLSEEAQSRIQFVESQIRAARGRLGAAAVDIETFLTPPAGICTWIETSRGPRRKASAALRAAPIDIGPSLREALFDVAETTVLTSATLTVANRFDHLRDRLGLLGEPVEERRFDSPFDFEEQALLGVATDIPAPDRPGHTDALHDAMERIVGATGGGTFLLFTSHYALERAYAAIEPELSDRGFTVMRQGELDRHALLARFREANNGVLFGTDSFWEGVDVRGSALRCVVIARLPFRVPTDPLFQARCEQIEAEGGNAFRDLSLPQAVLRLRQGFGRLVRSRGDAGAVVLLDSRVATKRYGVTFLDSLPPARRLLAPIEQIERTIAERFGQARPVDPLLDP